MRQMDRGTHRCGGVVWGGVVVLGRLCSPRTEALGTSLIICVASLSLSVWDRKYLCITPRSSPTSTRTRSWRYLIPGCPQPSPELPLPPTPRYAILCAARQLIIASLYRSMSRACLGSLNSLIPRTPRSRPPPWWLLYQATMMVKWCLLMCNCSIRSNSNSNSNPACTELQWACFTRNRCVLYPPYHIHAGDNSTTMHLSITMFYC